jgi:multicomponent K+:H+ antiporter subunit D
MSVNPGSLLSHLAVLPIVLPLLAGAVLLLLGRRSERVAGIFGAVTIVALLGIAATLLGITSSNAVLAYQVGNWPAPWGITLSVDRLSALMLGITAIVALASQLAALARNNPLTSRFPALLQFQLMGLNGAFLTGDLFNLFVFFEVLLAASYAMLLDGAWRGRLRAGLHYVTINLLGSALFLIAVSLLYGSVGTLNLADLAARIATLP